MEQSVIYYPEGHPLYVPQTSTATTATAATAAVTTATITKEEIASNLGSNSESNTQSDSVEETEEQNVKEEENRNKKKNNKNKKNRKSKDEKNNTEIVIYNNKYFVLCVGGQTIKWREDKTIAPIDVVQSYTIFNYKNDVFKGQPEKPTKTELKKTFGTHREDVCINTILQYGTIKKANMPKDSVYKNKKVCY